MRVHKLLKFSILVVITILLATWALTATYNSGDLEAGTVRGDTANVHSFYSYDPTSLSGTGTTINMTITIEVIDYNQEPGSGGTMGLIAYTSLDGSTNSKELGSVDVTSTGTHIITITNASLDDINYSDTSNWINLSTYEVVDDGSGPNSDDELEWNAVTIEINTLDSPPQSSNPQVNDTTFYPQVNYTFNTNWTDDVNLAGYIFSINQSGSWINSSFTSFSGTSNTSSNVTTLTASGETTVAWKFFANDTAGNWNETTVQTLTMSAPVAITNVQTDSATVANGGYVNISADVTQTSGGSIDSVRMEIYYPNETLAANYTMSNTAGDTYWNASYQVLWPPHGNHSIKIIANDTGGLENSDESVGVSPYLEISGSASITIDGGLSDWTGITNVSDDEQVIPWYNRSWIYRKNITVNGTQVNGTHTNFPLLVRITSDSDLSSKALANGSDILFVNSSGTKLNHDLELFNSTTGELIAWVNIPELAQSTDYELSLYYGNSGASSQENKNATWNSEYKGVWHMGDGDATSTDFYQDSSGNSNHGTLTDSDGDSLRSTGQIGYAYDFNGDADYIDAGTDASITSDIQSSNAYTLSAWVVITDQDWRSIIHKDRPFNDFGYELRISATDELTNSIGVNTDPWTYSLTNGSLSIGPWVHVSATWNGTHLRNYVNGTLISTSTNVPDPIAIGALSNVLIAHQQGAAADDAYFDGIIDEVRILDNALSNEWIQTEYNNQKNGSTMVSLGNEEIGILDYDMRQAGIANNDTHLFGFIKVNQSISNDVSYRMYIGNGTASNSTSKEGENIATTFDQYFNINSTHCDIINSTGVDIGDCTNATSAAQIEFSAELTTLGLSLNDIVNVTWETTFSNQRFDIAPDLNSFVEYTISQSGLSCGDTIVSNTTLSENFSCTGTAFIASADDIVIDGAGMILSGDNTGAAFDLNGKSDITIKNVIIHNFSIGINATGSTGVNLSNITLTNMTLDVWLNNTNATVDDGMIGAYNISGLLTVSDSQGKIQFLSAVNENHTNLSRDIQIGNNFAYVNSTQSGLNTNANITLYGLSNIGTPAIYKDGTICTSGCTKYSYSGGVFVFNVSGFSNYSSGDNSNLSINDTTDFGAVATDSQVQFHANYTNITSGLPIFDGSVNCTITFNISGGWTTVMNMSYNGVAEIYEYNRSFSSAGTYNYNVSCNGSGIGYEDLNVTDSVQINNPATVSIIYPENTTYTNSTINITYDVSNQNQCRIELNGVNMSYPLCSNTTLTYVHFNDSAKLLALDFAEGTGNKTYDRSTFNRFGNLTGNAVWINTTKFGSAINLSDGNDDYVEIADTNSFGIEDEFTMMAWINPTSTDNFARILTKSHTANSDPYTIISLQFNNFGPQTASFCVTTSSTDTCTATSNTFSTNTWYHVAGRYNGTHIAIFYNGSLETDTAKTGNVDRNSMSFRIGDNPFNSDQDFQGLVDEVLILNRSLSDIEIRQYYEAQAFSGSHQLTIWANNSEGEWSSESVNFSINQTISQANINIINPENTTYTNSSIDITYNVSNQEECKIQLNNINMSYPLCSNTTLTHVHFNDSAKMLAFDFAEGTGTEAYDRGPFSETATFTSDPTWITTGAVGSALTFDGNDDIRVNRDLNLDNTNQVTIATWVNFSSTSGWQTMLGQDTDNSSFTDNGAFYFQKTTDGAASCGRTSNKFTFILSTGNSCNILYAESTTSATTNEWHFLVGTYNGTHITIYVDGVQENSTRGLTHIQPLTGNLNIGSGYYNGGSVDYVLGSMDEVAIWNRSLSANEIQALYNNNSFNGSHQLKVWAKNYVGEWNFDSANFSIPGTADATTVSIVYPENTIYPNSTINITYDVSNQDTCKIQFGGVNSSYLNCTNTTLSYIHLNESTRMLALDFSTGAGTTIYDRTPDEHTITTTGAPVWNTSGKRGTAMTFDGSDDYLTTAGTVSDNIANNITVMAWVYPRVATGSYRAIVSEAYAGDGNVEFVLNLGGSLGTDTFHTGFFDGSWRMIEDNDTVQTDEWVHLVGTYDGSYLKLYRNGLLVSQSSNLDRSLPSGSNGWYIGKRHDTAGGNHHWNGSIDEVLVLNRTMSATEVSRAYHESLYDGEQSMKVWANNSEGTWTSDSANFNISFNNTAPNITTPSIGPVNPHERETLTCNATAADSDSTPIYIEYAWYNYSGAGFTQIHSGLVQVTNDTSTQIATLGAGNISGNNIWNCSVRSFDGYNFSEWKSASVNVSSLNLQNTSTATISETLALAAQTNDVSAVADSDNVRHGFYFYLTGGYLIYELTLNNSFKVGNSWNISQFTLNIEGYQEATNSHYLYLYNLETSSWDLIENSFGQGSDSLYSYDLFENFSQYVTENGRLHLRVNQSTAGGVNNPSYEMQLDKVALTLGSTTTNNLLNGTGSYAYDRSLLNQTVETWYLSSESNGLDAILTSNNTRHTFNMEHVGGYVIYNMTLNDTFASASTYNISEARLYIEGYQEGTDTKDVGIFNWTSREWEMLDDSISQGADVFNQYVVTDGFSDYVNNGGTLLLRFNHTSGGGLSSTSYEMQIDNIFLRLQQDGNSVPKNTTPGSYHYDYSVVNGTKELWLINTETNTYESTIESDNTRHQHYVTQYSGYLTYNITLNSTFSTGSGFNVSKVELVIEGYQSGTNAHDLEIYNFTGDYWMILDNNFKQGADELRTYDLAENFSDIVNAAGTMLIRFNHSNTGGTNSPTYDVKIDSLVVRNQQFIDSTPLSTNNGSYDYKYSLINNTLEDWYIVQNGGDYTRTRDSNNSYETYYMQHQKGHKIYNISVEPTFKTGNQWNITSVELFTEMRQLNSDAHNFEIYNFTGAVWQLLDDSVPQGQVPTYYDITEGFSDYVNQNNDLYVRYTHNNSGYENSLTYSLEIDHIALRMFKNSESSIITSATGQYLFDTVNVSYTESETDVTIVSGAASNTRASNDSYHRYYFDAQNGYVSYNINISDEFKVGNSWNISKFDLIVEGYQENGNYNYLQVYNQNSSSWENIESSFQTSQDQRYYTLTSNFSEYVNVNGTMEFRVFHFSSGFLSDTWEVFIDEINVRITQEGDAMLYSGFTESANITIWSPANNSEINMSDLNVVYSVTDSDSSIQNCTLYLDGSVYESNTSITEGINDTVQVSTTDGAHYFEVVCFDDSPAPISYSSGIYNFTTDLSPLIVAPRISPTAYFNRTVSILANVSDEDVSWVNFTIIAPNGSTMMDSQNGTRSGDVWSVAILLDAVGRWNYTINSKDAQGYTDSYEGQIRFLDISSNISTSSDASTTMTISGRVNLSNGSAANNTVVNVYLNDTAYAAGANWLDVSWPYRKKINITERNGTSFTDMQVLINVSTSELILSGKMNGSCSDMRFADDGGNPLDFWLQEGCNTSNTKIWVETDLIANENNTIYMYYGNLGATSSSNITSTFVFGDDFNDGTIDTEKWQDTTGFTETGGYLNASLTTYRIRSLRDFNGSYILETRTNTSTEATNGHQVGGFWASTSNGINILQHPTNAYYYRNDGSWAGAYSFTYIDEWIRIRVNATGSSSATYMLRESDNTTDTRTFSNSGLASEWVALGKRNDDGNTGQSYVGKWDYLFVREYAGMDPIITSIGEEENIGTSTNQSGHYSVNITTPSVGGDYLVVVNATSGDEYGQFNSTLYINQIPTMVIVLPTNATYDNSTINIAYNVSGEDECRIQLDGVNMSYPLCSNTTLTYAHFPDANKVLGLDFAEGAGTQAYDKSIYNNDGTLSGASWNLSAKHGTGFLADGVEDIEITDQTYFSPINTNMTLMAWFNVPTGASGLGTEACGGSGRYLVSKGADPTWEWGLENDNNGLLCFVLWNGTGTNIGEMSHGMTVNDGAWHHIAITINYSNEMNMYLDGEWVAHDNHFTGSMTEGSQALRIASRSDGNYFIGSIDDVAIYNKSLSQEEIRKKYFAGGFEGSHNLKIWVNNSAGIWNSDMVNFSIVRPSAAATLISPTTIEYVNSTLSVSYDVENNTQCFVQVNGQNNTFPMCSNTTLTYIHFNDSSKIYALDFSEGTGSAYDKSVYNELVTGSFTWNDTGRFGKGVTLNGSQYLQSPDRDRFSPSMNNITIASWLYVPPGANQVGNGACGGAGGYFLAKGNSNNWEYGLEVDSNARICANLWTLDGTDHGAVQYVATIDDGNWHFVVVTIEAGNNMTLYVNGQAQDQVTSFTGSMGNGNWSLDIGRRANDNYFNGSIDEIAMWDRILTPKEVENLYHEAYFPGNHIIKSWVGNGAYSYVSDEKNFTINGFSCNPQSGLDWNLNLADNCTVSGVDVSVDEWTIYSGTSGDVYLNNVNITYKDRIVGTVNGRGRLIREQLVNIIGDNS